jgi:glycosyltransferase involved in cell wall biosynthesis
MQLGAAGGVEQATYELVDAIARVDRRNAYRILAPRSACWEWNLPPGFRATRHAADEGATPPSLAFDLVHSTAGYIHPDLQERPGILTINDLQHLHYPEFFGREDWQNRERLYRDSAARARHIICISEHTRHDVHERYGVPLEKMTAIWIIPSRTVWDEIEAPRRTALLEAMGVHGPFLFYPAHDWPHKNHARLMEAMARAAPHLPHDMKLVLTGRPFGPGHPAAALMQQPALRGRVAHLGFRSPLEVRALFQQCEALVFPSLFEGFGMPVAEAMIAGRPVACSNATSLPEIAADAALFFDPTDVDDLAARMVEVATRADVRASLQAAALRRRHVFSWRATALRTIAVYERVAATLEPAAA